MAAACNLTFCVVGRDARQLAAARALQNSGYTVLGAEGAGQADYILLPMPMDAEAADLARILRAARPGTLALGGRISEPVRKAAQAAGVELVDYFLRPELACLNAVPTAEGCLALLMQLRQRTIWESEFLVLGYGRIGRAVARRLQALGGQVTIAARAPEQMAGKSEHDGAKPEQTPPAAGSFEVARVLKVAKPLMRGDDVKALQTALIERNYHCGTNGADGTYGRLTAYAVRCFQASKGLIVNGRADRYTIAALGGTWKE